MQKRSFSIKEFDEKPILQKKQNRNSGMLLFSWNVLPLSQEIIEQNLKALDFSQATTVEPSHELSHGNMY